MQATGPSEVAVSAACYTIKYYNTRYINFMKTKTEKIKNKKKT